QGTITQGGGDTLTVARLFAHGEAGVTLTEPGNTVSNVLGGTIVAGAAFSFTNSGNLTIGVPFSPDGITTNGGASAVNTINGGLTVLKTVSANGGDVNVQSAGNIVFGNGSIETSGGNATLTTGSSGAVQSNTGTTDVIASTLSVSAGSGGIGVS